MNKSIKATLLFLATIAPVYCFALSEANGLHFKAEIMTILNVVLLITSVISIRQFFWPGDLNHSPFHVLHIIFILLFYTIGLSFLINNKQEYPEYEHLSPIMCIVKFFFSFDIDSVKQWLIVFALVINVCYIVRKSRSVI